MVEVMPVRVVAGSLHLPFLFLRLEVREVHVVQWIVPTLVLGIHL